MTSESRQDLIQKYPKIFARRLIGGGLECGDGWVPLMDALCESIQGYIDNNPHLTNAQVEAVQVKEKFGTLRFYVEFVQREGEKSKYWTPERERLSYEYIQGMIRFAEVISRRTCEECGRQGSLRNDGWYRVRCNEHAKSESI